MNKSSHQNHRPFNFLSKPLKSIHNIFQSPFNIKSLSISSMGSTGVIFIQIQKGSFVLKSSNQGPKDEFLNHLAQMMDIRVPNSFCLTCSDQQFDIIMFKIEQFCEKDEVLFERIKTKLDFPFYQIMQYIPAVSFAQIGPLRFEKYMIQQHKLHMLGMGLGFDLIINNSDRFRLIWSGEGNLSNVLVQLQDYQNYSLNDIKNRSDLNVGLSTYTFIDHQGNLLDLTNPLAAANFQQYVSLLTSFYVQLIRWLGQDIPTPQYFSNLTRQIQLYTQYTLNESQLKIIARGIISLTKSFLTCVSQQKPRNLYQSLVKGEEQLSSKFKTKSTNTYWNNYWNTELKKVNISYLQEIHTKISAIYTTYPETIQKTLQQTKITNEIILNNNAASSPEQEKNQQSEESHHEIIENSQKSVQDIRPKQKSEKKSVKKSQKSQKSNRSITQHKNNSNQKQEFLADEINEKQRQLSQQSRIVEAKAQKVRRWKQKLVNFTANNSKKI